MREDNTAQPTLQPRVPEQEGRELSDLPLAPGIPAHGSFVVEMPVERLVGAELEVVPDANIYGLEPQLTIPLGVAADRIGGFTSDVVALSRASAA